MKDVSYLLKLTGRCQDLEKTAIAPEVVEQLRIWATELAGRGLQLKGRRSTEWDPPPQVRFATTRRWRKPDSNRRSQATVSSGASGHAPPREARVG